MKHLKILLLIALTLGFTACSDKNDNSNNHGSATNTTTPTQTPIPPTIDPNTLSTYKSLTLSAEQTTLNKDDNTTLKLLATLPDGTSKELNTNIEYTITPNGSAEVNNSTLTAKQDGTLTIQGKAGNTLSNTLTLTVTWTVNGHTLPPEPDKALNDGTLLGIDVNNNGVRDDVERWIYEEYKDKHPIYIDIAMQAARGYKKVLETPERAKEIHGYATAYLDCLSYYKYEAKYYGEPILIKDDSGVGEYFRSKIYYSTKERYDAYVQYSTLLSGDSYMLIEGKEQKVACDFDTIKYEK
ncbi:MAG TPA: hypothetical protein PLH07_02005 [Sulfurovum sp.]|nr:MAG: hypothetical protein B7Y63_03170 [Sulfurovum sp. 35-42-20]OYZ26012.1 MAG: hypothetical protein B7Y23_03145 [Sulfurovum sp. 16-42-52]OYZ49189.1 MAG: hypothetical protein B7Y13_05505 [Sulfurovum sp. 24-42-9]OZA46052.1 MAG: hypothetical protein B7X80_03740 [Sulfurovum sp. 17-42-90]OZA59700.1 MAG: hypothetical protein B7X69_07125 [Sulfurovum sp. 39-42-12]HQR73915.1 hypothetical protein [Sulfurovum sp.]